MEEKKRILNIHEQKFADIVVFQANTTIFHTNTNSSLKNLETQVGQLAQTLQNQSREAFPSDTKRNPNGSLAITLRSGRELQKIEEDEIKLTERKSKRKLAKKTSLTEHN